VCQQARFVHAVTAVTRFAAGKHSEHLRFDRHDCTPCAAVPAARDFISVAKDQISRPKPMPTELASERGDIPSKMPRNHKRPTFSKSPENLQKKNNVSEANLQADGPALL
jgi:hypothetical protein